MGSIFSKQPLPPQQFPPNTYPHRRRYQTVVIGLEGAGKSNIVHRLCPRKDSPSPFLLESVPTVGIDVCHLPHESLSPLKHHHHYVPPPPPLPPLPKMDSLLSSSSNAEQNTDEDKDKDPSNNTASPSSSFDTATTNTPKEQHDEHQEEQEPPQSDTKNIKLLLYDLSGSSRFRSHYPPFVKQTHAIIYVLDASAPHARFEESRRFLCEILEEWNPDSYKIPLLVYANKMDSLQARRIEEIRDRLALGRGVELGWGAEAAEIAVVGGGGGGGIVNKRRVWRLQGASAATGEGLMEGIDWLVVQLEVQRCEEHREEDARQRG